MLPNPRAYLERRVSEGWYAYILAASPNCIRAFGGAGEDIYFLCSLVEIFISTSNFHFKLRIYQSC